VPGSLWGLLAKLSWADPGLIRPHIMPLVAQVQGVAGADGVAVVSNVNVVAKSYFLVRRIHMFVEQDSTNPLDWDSTWFTNVQLEDQERQFPLFRVAMSMGPHASRMNSAGNPVEYVDYPLTFLPSARLAATFTPLLGFPFGASAATALTTRRVGLNLEGALVNEKLVDRLLADNRRELAKAGLLGGR